MSLDDLISKYLDGDLTEIDDSILRKTVSDDPAAKDIFDASVLIHSACMEDARSILPPRELVSKTEDRVLMKILAQQPLFIDTVYKTRRYIVMASFVIAFLCLSVFQISDLYLPGWNIGNVLSSLLNTEKQRMANETVPEDNQVLFVSKAHESALIAANSIRKVPAILKAENIQGNLQPSAIVVASNEVKTLDRYIAENENYTPQVKENAGINTDSRISQGAGLPNQVTSNYPGKLSPMSQVSERKNPGMVLSLNQPDFSFHSGEVFLSSFLGTDLLNKSNEKSAVSNFSQSIAYAFSKSQRLGIEFGYSTFSYDDIVKVSVPLDNPGMLNFSPTSKVEVLNPELKTNSYIEFPATVNHQKQFIWGSAFFEQEFISYSGFTVNGRLGLGASSDGPLGYGKAILSYRILSVLHLTAGIEGKLYEAKIYKSNTIADEVKSNLNLIYGFQIKF